MSTIISALFAFAALAAVAGQASARPNGAPGPGSCGQFMYWHGGTCVDARNRPAAKSWSDDMLEKKWAS